MWAFQRQRLAIKTDMAAIALVEAGEDIKESGFASTIRADQAINFPAPDGQADFFERLYAAELLADATGIEQNIELCRHLFATTVISRRWRDSGQSPAGR